MPNPTIKILIQEGAVFLGKHAVPEARTLCELLIARLLKCKRLDLLLHQDETLEDRYLDALRRGLKRAAAHEPIQYILGQWDFHNISLKVDHRALIPRPETEELVERVLHDPLLQRRDAAILDIGTGTGAIILALAAATRHLHLSYTATDLSSEALALARENAEMLDLADRVSFIHGFSCRMLPAGSADIIVSNPPYIPTHTVNALPPHILDHEPRLALDGGPDGLRTLQQITLDTVMVLKPGGHLYYEIGEDQGPAVTQILEKAGFSNITIRRDHAGNPRFAQAQLS